MTLFSVSYTKKNLSLLLSSFLILVGTIFIVPYGSFQEAGIVIKFWIGISIMSLGFIISWAIPSINLAWFWSITILTRLILILMEPGDDIWRYLWEGYIQNLGFSPYDLAPNALELIPYRTEWWSLMNHPDTSAIYPPLIQLGFRFLALISPSVFVFKFAFILADLGICWLLTRKFSLQKTFIYAWNPLIIYSFAGGGHYDSWFLLPLVGAWLVFFEEGRSKEEEGRRKDRSWKKWMGTQTPVEEGRRKLEEGRRKLEEGSWKKWMGTQTSVEEGRSKEEEGRRKLEEGSWKKWMGTQTVDDGVFNPKEQDNYRWYWSAFLIGISVAIKWVSLPILSFVVWQKILCFREQGTGNREEKRIKINMLHSAEKSDKQEHNFHRNLQLYEVHKTRFLRFKLDDKTLSCLLHQVQEAGFLLLIGLLPMCVAALNFCQPGKCSLIPTSSNFVVNGRSAELIPYLVSFVSEQ
ncbi:MAG: hypothetical protein F6K35_05800, partial [Okeania sp. SIO2H7]|nr:hypothetical protein [Okeania sp. SIO2H7]